MKFVKQAVFILALINSSCLLTLRQSYNSFSTTSVANASGARTYFARESRRVARKTKTENSYLSTVLLSSCTYLLNEAKVINYTTSTVNVINEPSKASIADTNPLKKKKFINNLTQAIKQPDLYTSSTQKKARKPNNENPFIQAMQKKLDEPTRKTKRLNYQRKHD